MKTKPAFIASLLLAACEPAPPVVSDSANLPLGQLFASASRIEVTASAPRARVESKDAATIRAILTAIGKDQAATSGMPKCLTPTEIHFFDAANRKLGSFGSCASAGVAEEAKDGGRIDLPSGAMGGVVVRDLPGLRKALAGIQIALP